MTLLNILNEVEEINTVVGYELEFDGGLDENILESISENLLTLTESTQEVLGKKAIDMLWQVIKDHNAKTAKRLGANPDTVVARKKLATVRFITKGTLKKATKSRAEMRVGGGIPKTAFVYGVGSEDVAKFKGDVGAAQAALTVDKDGGIRFKADIDGHDWKTMYKELITTVNITGGKRVKVIDGDGTELVNHATSEAKSRLKAKKIVIDILKKFDVDESNYPTIRSEEDEIKYTKNKNTGRNGKGVAAKKAAQRADTQRRENGEEKAAATYYNIKAADEGPAYENGEAVLKLEISLVSLLKSPVVIAEFGEDVDIKTAKKFMGAKITDVNPNFKIATKYATLQVK